MYSNLSTILQTTVMKTKLKIRALALKVPIAVTLRAVPVDRENPSDRRFLFKEVSHGTKFRFTREIAEDQNEYPYFRLSIETDTKINGRIYIPRSLEIRPGKVVLKSV